jgi:hypothetical protein
MMQLRIAREISRSRLKAGMTMLKVGSSFPPFLYKHTTEINMREPAVVAHCRRAWTGQNDRPGGGFSNRVPGGIAEIDT